MVHDYVLLTFAFVFEDVKQINYFCMPGIKYDDF